MIKANFLRNNNGDIYSFEIKDHDVEIVCAAVSALALNAVNAIEAFTEVDFLLDYEETGGYIRFEAPCIKDGETHEGVRLLLESLALGLKGIKEQYGECISIRDKEVQ